MSVFSNKINRQQIEQINNRKVKQGLKNSEQRFLDHKQIKKALGKSGIKKGEKVNTYQRIRIINYKSNTKMSSQNSEGSDLDFSVIERKSLRQQKLSFSVQSLLEQHQQGQVGAQIEQEECEFREQIVGVEPYSEVQQDVGVQKGSFLQDLQKLQDELSFQTQIYNIYSDSPSIINSNSQNPLTKSNIYASNSNLKTTKQQSNSQLVDDYGYLVIDFAPINNRKNSQRIGDLSKSNKNQKLYTRQGTLSSRRLKLSSQSSGLLEHQTKSSKGKGTEGKGLKSKTKSKGKNIKSYAFGKVTSPQRTPVEKSASKEKTLIKPIKTKLKPQLKQKHLTTRTQKSPTIIKTLSKSKSPSPKTLFSSTTFKSSKNTTTTSNESIKIPTSKLSAKSTKREDNVYSEYYGFVEGMGGSQQLAMKSNCIYKKGENSAVMKSPGTKKVVFSKSKCKKGVHWHSPSSRQLATGFKKKAVQNI